ncbi:MAG: FliH/SctL family protein [Janthinobacterium lividum]
MSSNFAATLLPLEYRDIAFLHSRAHAELHPEHAGVPEQEVERRVLFAQEEAVAATENRLRAEVAAEQEKCRQQLLQTLEAFQRERTGYFDRVESEIVHLALSIARKILQRESELDPTLLGALVRIALDRMQSGTEVKVAVLPAEAELWRALAVGQGPEPRWLVEENPALQPGDCMVKTELGEANFSLEAQLCDVEQSFRGLLAHKPGAR